MVVALGSINSMESLFTELALFCHQRRAIMTLYTHSYGSLIQRKPYRFACAISIIGC
jgi:hypothetical protein